MIELNIPIRWGVVRGRFVKDGEYYMIASDDMTADHFIRLRPADARALAQDILDTVPGPEDIAPPTGSVLQNAQGLVPVRADPLTLHPALFTINGETPFPDEDGDWVYRVNGTSSYLTLAPHGWWGGVWQPLPNGDAAAGALLALHHLHKGTTYEVEVQGPMAALKEWADAQG